MKGFTEKDRGHLSGSVSPSLGFYRWAGKSHTDCYLLSVSYRSFKVSSPVTMFQTRSDLSIFEAYVTTQGYLPPPTPPPHPRRSSVSRWGTQQAQRLLTS